MKRFVGLSVALSALVLPAPPAFAADGEDAPAPAPYRAECDQAYSAFQPAWDALFASPLAAVFGPLEAGVCGSQKHVPAP